MDKKIILWNLNQRLCTKVFDLPEIATCVSFISESDNRFISGSFDMIIRLWNINTKSIVDWTKTQELITAIQCSPDAKRICVGLYKGQCIIYYLQQDK